MAEDDNGQETPDKEENAEQQRIVDKLRRLRSLKLVLWAITLTFAPVVGLAGMFTGSKTILIFMIVIYVAFFLLVALVITFTRCPKCGRLFNLSLTWSNPWVRRCLHCGLKLKDI